MGTSNPSTRGTAAKANTYQNVEPNAAVMAAAVISLGSEEPGLMETCDGVVLEVRPEDTIYTPPGEEHWHGATPED